MWSWLSVALSGFISVSANESNNKAQAVVFKTLSMVFLLAMIWNVPGEMSAAMNWIASGLIVSVLADTFYILKNHSRLSFIAFLLAQLCYSKAFWLQISGDIVWWLPALLVASGIVLFFLLLPQLDRLIFPVTMMGVVLVQLAWAAGENWLIQQSLASSLGFIGAIVLIASAGMLAIHDYRKPFRCGRYLISGSYLLAHSLITASVVL